MKKYSQFVYPGEFVEGLRKNWDSFQRTMASPKRVKTEISRKSVPQQRHPPFPDMDELRFLLDVIYHVSLMKEEGRETRLRLAYLTPEDFASDGKQIMNLHNLEHFVFHPEHPYNVSTIRRIAPAIDPRQSLLLVCNSADLGNTTVFNGPVVWGLLHLGLEWWQALSGRSTAAICPPNCLILSSFGSGNVTASVLGRVLFRLENGRPVDVVLDSISNGPIGVFLRPMANNLYADAVSRLGTTKYHEDADSDRHPVLQYFRVIENIIRFAAEKRHGATFLIVPDEFDMLDHRLADRVSIKYPLSGVSLWNSVIDESEANRKYFDKLFTKKYQFLVNDPKAKTKDLKELSHWEHKRDRMEEKLRECEDFISSLSGVDGAVVLTTKLRLIGFGAEIIAQSPSLTHVKVATDSYGDAGEAIPINSFGTRHRSAFRFCSSYEDCVAFVVSQDGGTKAVKRVGPDVILWTDVSVGRSAL